VKSVRHKLYALLLVVIACIAVAVPIAVAQNATDTTTPGYGNGDYKQFLWSVIAWLLYSLSGGLLAFIQQQNFDPKKFATSFVWAIVVAGLSIFFGMQPGEVTSQYPGLVEDILKAIGNTGFFTTLIYFFDKASRIVYGLYDVWKTGAKKAAETS
jgi:small basic protein